MSWKATKRSLHVGPKVKLASGQYLPEPAEDMAVKVDVPPSDEEDATEKQSNPFEMSEFAMSLPNVNGEIKEDQFCYDKFVEDFVEFNNNDDEDEDFYVDFNESGCSALGQSVSSFMSWTDELEDDKIQEIQRLKDEMEQTLYEPEASPITDTESLEEILCWKNDHPHLRVVGIGKKIHLQEFPSNLTFMDEDETTNPGTEQDVESEVIASHGIYDELEDSSNRLFTMEPTGLDEECEVDNPGIKKNDDCKIIFSHRSPIELEGNSTNPLVKSVSNERTDVTIGDQQIAEGGGVLREKVKRFVMDQLVLYVLSETVKSRETLLVQTAARSFETEEYEPVPLSSRRPNTREVEFSEVIHKKPNFVKTTSSRCTPTPTIVNAPLDSFLQVSSMSIHEFPRKSAAHSRQQSAFSSTSNISDTMNVNRVSSNANSYHTGHKSNLRQPPFSIITLPKPDSFPSLSEKAKPVGVRGYHSAADRRKAGLWDRRFSCITTGHERFLQPLEEISTKRTQVSAPNSPAKWSRHNTLPPINGMDALSKNPASIHGISSLASKDNETNSKLPTDKNKVKNKVSLLPLNIPALNSGLTRIQLAKQLLQSIEDTDRWHTNGHVGLGTKYVQGNKLTKGKLKPKAGSDK